MTATDDSLLFSGEICGEKDGTKIEKGVVITESYLKEQEQNLQQIADYFISYPDLFLDMITPEEEKFRLFFYQRIFLRAMMRFKTIYLTACRAFSKSFLTILGLFLQCIFMPGTKRFICAPGKSQSAKIAKEKIFEIFKHWPLLRKEIIGGDVSETPGLYGNDYVTLNFRNGSVLDVVAPLGSTLGGRRCGGLVDEVKLHDQQELDTIVLPLLNVSRRLPDNTVNPSEPNQQVAYCTSAWQKTSFAYARLLDVFEKSIIEPQKAFVFGCDYKVPVLHGLLDRDFINDLKMSPSFNETTFATEYKLMYS